MLILQSTPHIQWAFVLLQLHASLTLKPMQQNELLPDYFLDPDRFKMFG